MSVKGVPTVIGLNKTTLKLGANMTDQLTPVFQPDEMGDVKYSSSNPGIAKVDEASGLVTAVSEGVATITITAGEGVTNTCEVKVVPEPDRVTIDGSEFNIIVGKIIDLPVTMKMENGSEECMTTYTLSTSNKKYVAVNNSGQVKGVKAGSATVTLTAGNGDVVTCKVVVRANPRKVVLNQSKLTIGVGMESRLQVRVYYSSSGNFVYSAEDNQGVGSFYTSDANIVEIDPVTGEMTAKAKGTATVGFRTLNGKSASCKVNVLAAPTSISLNKTELKLGEMMTAALSVSFNENEYGWLKYSSSNESAVVVNENGELTAVSAGEAVITVETLNQVKAQCKVNVVPAPDDIVLNMTSSNLAINGKITLEADYSYKGADNCMAVLTYKSSNPKIATVSSAGVVKGVKAGTAIIRVSAQNGEYADCTVVVRKKPTKVQFATNSTMLGVGQKVKIAAKIFYSGGNCIYSMNDTSYARLSVDDTSIAKIDPATGEIIGVEVGRTYVRLTTYNGKTASVKVDVGPGPEWLMFDDPILTLSEGDTYSMNCQLSPGSVTTMSYASSNPSVAVVSGSGSVCMISAVGRGNATITATSANGTTTTCELKVLAKPESISFEKDRITIGMDDTVELPKVTVASSEGDCSQAVAYTVDGDAVEMVAPGFVTGVAAGTATVTATASNGLQAVCTVVVQPKPTKITLMAEKSVIAVGDSTMLSVQMDAAGSYTFSVDDDSVLRVSSGGKVTALKAGTTKITVESYNGCTDVCEITVLPVSQWVRFDADALAIGVGMSQQLGASIQKDTFGELIYASGDESKAIVDASGNVQAVAPGEVLIYVYVKGHTEIFDTCEVTVLAKPEKIVLSTNELSLRKGKQAVIEANLSCASGAECYGAVKYASSNAAVATVSSDGVVLAVEAGEATITVSLDSDSAISETCKVVVEETGVGFDASEMSLSIGETCVLGIDLPEGKNGFSLTSSNEAVAKVDAQTHVLTAVAVGETTITAINGGDQATCRIVVTQKPTSVALSEERKQLVIGEAFKLAATLQPAGTAAQLIFETSDEKIAVVSDDGRVEAVGYGSAVITVRNHDGSLKAECEINAVYEPELIRFGEIGDIVIAAGDSYVLETPVMYNANGDCGGEYTLAISDSNVARVSAANGRHVIEGIAEGTATLRLKTQNGKNAMRTVRVEAAPDSIRFADENIRMAVGESFAPAVVSDSGAPVAVRFASSNVACISVDENGMLCANAEGLAKITATAVNFPALTAEINIQVVKAPAAMSLSRSEIVLAVGERFKLAPVYADGTGSANVNFASDDETVVQTGRDGSIRAVGLGEAIVTATAFNGCTAGCKVTVKAAPTQLNVNPGSIVACTADEIQLTASFGGSGEYANPIFESLDPAIATVDAGGIVRFAAVGETVIRVSTFNGLTVDVPVKVCETPSSVSFDPEAAVILNGDSAQLNIVFDKGAGYYTLESSNPEILSVSADSVVQANSPGKAIITLNMPALKLSETCQVTVVESLDGIALSAEKTTLELHETVQLNAEFLPANVIGTGLVTYASSDEGIASVDSVTGVVTGEAYGTAVITATTGDGRIAQIEINVLGGKRRMMIAYYFGEAGDDGYLPFAYNNGYSMAQTFAGATVEGQEYDIAGPLSNASKSTLLGTIDSHFADATDDDVSVIYICAHGSASYGPTGEYAFRLDNTHAVMASELMNRIEKIKGRVILIMDSCYSGGMIDCNKSRLDAQGGRISILASSHRSTSSCYWDVDEKLASIDFFTHALLYGVGFNEKNSASFQRGWFDFSGGPADDAGNNDGQVTVRELFSYADALTMANIAKSKGQSQFRGNPLQDPQCYIGEMNEDLVLFAR